MAVMYHKSAGLIIDGLGDLPVADLDGKTPLEAASTPVLDRLATGGQYGQYLRGVVSRCAHACECLYSGRAGAIASA